MSINIKQIAKLAGVSPSTVSRIINGKKCISEATKNKVMEIVNRENYQPNEIAKSMKNKQTNTICLMLPTIENVAYAPIAKGVEEIARENDYIVVICNTDEDKLKEAKYIENMKNRMVDGFVIASAFREHENLVKLRNEGFPVVLASRYELSDIHTIDVCTVNDYRAAYIVTEYLIKTNHHHISLAIGNLDIYYSRERLRGYKDALIDNGIEFDPDLIMYFDKDNSCFYPKTLDLVKRRPDIDAIFASSDMKAIYILKALNELHIRVPEDISLFGFDNISIASACYPALSTVSQSPNELGRVAARNLIKQIKFKRKYGHLPIPQYNLIDYNLIIRESCITINPDKQK